MPDSNTQPAGIKLIVYKRIVPGDIKKFRAESNNSDNGGGARDLRFSPDSVFSPLFKRMFTMSGSDNTLIGQLYWQKQPPTNVTIHQPTNSRPGEVRIAKVHQCFPEQARPTDTNDCVLILVLDNENHVWPYFTSEQSLRNDNWHPAVRDPILRGLNAHCRGTPNGYVDFENGREWNNGR